MITENQIETALECVIKLAMGLDPKTGEEAKEDSVLNSPEIIRTMFTVKAVLEERLYNPQPVAETESEAAKPAPKRKKDTRKEGFPPEIVDKFKFQRSTTVTHFIRDMYACADTNEYKPVKAGQILDRLVAEGMLERAHDEELDVDYKSVTEKGKEFGLSNRRVEYGLGGRSYISVIFNAKAQRYLVDRMDKIVNGEVFED